MVKSGDKSLMGRNARSRPVAGLASGPVALTGEEDSVNKTQMNKTKRVPGTTYPPIELTGADREFYEAQKRALAEIVTAYRIPNELIGDYVRLFWKCPDCGARSVSRWHLQSGASGFACELPCPFEVQLGGADDGEELDQNALARLASANPVSIETRYGKRYFAGVLLPTEEE
jgi:hypothetical protein